MKLTGYEVDAAVVGKTVEYASLDGSSPSIKFTDGMELEGEVFDSGPGAWGEHESATARFTLSGEAASKPVVAIDPGVDTEEDADVRRRKPDWAQLDHLVTGARQRGFTPEQCEYLAACIGCAWAKGHGAGEREAKR